MYSLLVSAQPWHHRRDTMPAGRVLQLGYTPRDMLNRFHPSGALDIDALSKLPALFVEEYAPGTGQYAQVGRFTRVQMVGSELHLEYFFEQDIAPILMDNVVAHAADLGIMLPRRGITELDHTHWAVKDVNLFEILLTRFRSSGREQNVFRLPVTPVVDRLQLSAMMPFQGFDAVYRAIKDAAEENGMRCDRADTVWATPAIIDDVANLIDRSSIVVIDCTGKNPNVYYELGLAHAWGKEVIMITQNSSDIPFDIQHLRHIRYLPNQEGLADLRTRLAERIRDLI